MRLATNLWEDASNLLRQELAESAWHSTFSGVSIELVDESDSAVSVNLIVPNKIAKARIETRYRSLIEEVLTQLTSREIILGVEVRIAPAQATQLSAMLRNTSPDSVSHNSYSGPDYANLHARSQSGQPNRANQNTVQQFSNTPNRVESTFEQPSHNSGQNTSGLLQTENSTGQYLTGRSLNSQTTAESANSFASTSVDNSLSAEAASDVSASSSQSIPGISDRHTFQRFVVGSSNRFAHAAAMAVAEQPSMAYNPLFIYGKAGLGKTHLLQAICHYCLTQLRQPDLKVRYVTTETLLSEFIDAIRSGSQNDFKRRYREVDVLVIDDIQFLEGKDALQEELFHTFNALHQADRQIVLSSDRPPDAIATLEDRLRSRFQMGLITDIQPPDVETRHAILQMRARQEGLNIADDLLYYIAEHITNNIRELEGALVRTAAFSKIYDRELTTDVIRNEVLKDLIDSPEPRIINAELIMKTASDHFGFTIEELRSRSRRRPLAEARHITMYAMRELTDMSFPGIANEFGARDHSTVMYGVRKVTNLLPERQRTYDKVTEFLHIVRTGNPLN